MFFFVIVVMALLIDIFIVKGSGIPFVIFCLICYAAGRLDQEIEGDKSKHAKSSLSEDRVF